MKKCNICGGTTTPIEVREQMMGSKELFTYHQCTDCGHTHLDPIPADLGKYYDTKEYYSFKTDDNAPGKKNMKSRLKTLLIAIGITKNPLFSSALQAVLSVQNITPQSKILDYGCGAGQFADELNTLGFTLTKGYDPFLPDSTNRNGEWYLTNDLAAVKATQWDVITLNHVFEHLQYPVKELQDLRQLLSPKGKLILRYPIIDSYAFERYRENWVQFDAPRHLNLFTRKSTRLAVEKAGGFSIVSMYDDSFHFQFTGSELYLKGLSLHPENNNRKKRFLSLSTYRYHFLAKKLNRQHRGDQMTIILERN